MLSEPAALGRRQTSYMYPVLHLLAISPSCLAAPLPLPTVDPHLYLVVTPSPQIYLHISVCALSLAVEKSESREHSVESVGMKWGKSGIISKILPAYGQKYIQIPRLAAINKTYKQYVCNQ